MRLRLFLRRLTISAPRMSVRSAMPWPLRWALLAIVLGFCAAIGLWAFELGKELAGLDKASKAELVRLRAEVASLQTELAESRSDRDKAQSIANTAGTLVTTEKASQEKLAEQVKQLEADNRALRDDLGFFEKLIPADGAQGLVIRGLQAEVLPGGKLKWQVMVMQATKNAPEFNGRVELVFAGLQSGKPWSAPLADGPVPVKLLQYGRVEGEFVLPEQVQVKSVTARVLDGAQVRANQTIRL